MRVRVRLACVCVSSPRVPARTSSRPRQQSGAQEGAEGLSGHRQSARAPTPHRPRYVSRPQHPRSPWR